MSYVCEVDFLHLSWLLGGVGDVYPSSTRSLIWQPAAGCNILVASSLKTPKARVSKSSLQHTPRDQQLVLWRAVDGMLMEKFEPKKTLEQGWNNSKTLNISAHLGPKNFGKPSCASSTRTSPYFHR